MYTYALFKTPKTDLLFTEGIAGSLRVVGTKHLSALVESEIDLEAMQQDDSQLVQAVLTHDRVICDLFWQRTILPLRFGTCFVSEESLLQYLELHQDQYLLKLEQFEGKAEYRLKLTPAEIPMTLPESDLTGKDYLLSKKKRFKEQTEQRSQQQQALKGLLSAIATTYPNYILNEAQEGIEKLYLLVDRQAEGKLYENLQLWQVQCRDWELMLSEALPPYHFV
jgi:hypothetical protein